MSSSHITDILQYDASGETAMNRDANPNGGQSSSSSLLLFFVALGFGVLFTNLWIIIGVRYCFRARQRARLVLDANLEAGVDNIQPADYGQIIRRRREKKLLTADEVNEWFPAITYKQWRVQRESQGLSQEGGVSVPGVDEEAPAACVARRSESGNNFEMQCFPAVVQPISADQATPEHTAQATPKHTEAPGGTESKDDRPEVETLKQGRIRDGAASESSIDFEAMKDHKLEVPQGVSSGDNCAICIDLLEESDEVRGLTCGHAFHAACIDPWLTHRRASCPLCKADYYRPKPPIQSEQSNSGHTLGTVQSGRRPSEYYDQPALGPSRLLFYVFSQPRTYPVVRHAASLPTHISPEPAHVRSGRPRINFNSWIPGFARLGRRIRPDGVPRQAGQSQT